MAGLLKLSPSLLKLPPSVVVFLSPLRHSILQHYAASGRKSWRRAMAKSDYLPTIHASEYLNISPRTLEKYRVVGGGPAFHKFGRRVLYCLKDLEDWAGSRRRRSTSDPGQAA